MQLQLATQRVPRTPKPRAPRVPHDVTPEVRAGILRARAEVVRAAERLLAAEPEHHYARASALEALHEWKRSLAWWERQARADRAHRRVMQRLGFKA